MPELSFEDLLDDSPTKKSIGIVDPLELEDELHPVKSDTLHTPGPKKPPQQHMKQQQPYTAQAITPQHMKQGTSTIPTNQTASGRNVAGSATTVAKTTAPPAQTLNATKTTAMTTASAPVVLNSKNILPKSVSAGAAGGGSISQFVKASQKNLVPGGRTLTRNPATSIATTTSTFGGKTAIKTANGQIIYIQKKNTSGSAGNGGSTGGSGGVVTTTATGSRFTASTGNAANVNTVTPTTAGNNKPVAFKLMRTSGGTLVPFKGTNAVTTTTAGVTPSNVDLAAKKTFTLSPKVASQLSATAGGGNMRIISTSGGQVVIQATSSPAITTTANTTVVNRSATTTAPGSTTNTTYRLQQQSRGTACASAINSNNPANNNKGPAAPGGQKILLRTSSGKQIIVSNQQIIKLSPTPGGVTSNSPSLSTSSTMSISSTKGHVSTNSCSATNTASSNARQLQAIQLPGKSGQYLRVLQKGNTSADTSVGNASNTVTTTATASVSLAGAAQSTSSAATSTIKILNAAGVPPKFTVVRPSQTGSTKLILTQSPKKESSGVPITFSPITSKVQKTIVTVPQLRPLSDGQRISYSASNTNTTSTNSNIISSTNSQLINNTNSNQALIKSYPGSSNGTAMHTNPMLRKHKISEINTELKRITAVNNVEGSSTGAADDSGIDNVLEPPGSKKLAAGGRIVMLPRSMLRATGDGQVHQVTMQSNVVGGVDNNNKNGRQSPTHKMSLQQHQQKQQNQHQQMQSVLKSSNNLVLAADMSGQKSLLLTGKIQVEFAQQQQQQQQKILQLKRQIQKEPYHHELNQQLDNKYGINKLPSLVRDSGSNNINNNTNNNSNNGSNSNNNADNNLLNFKIKLEPMDDVKDIKPDINDLPTDANGGIRRKHCNCSKSQCLKLYCDCFANGEFCQDCTCKDCFNNLQYEDQRQRAIKNCLERNPSAFKPKITTSQEQGDMRHNKGCNCKRSGCLKNYCECYEAKIPCSSNCKCVGCRNIEERPDLDMDPIDPKLLASIASASLPAGGQKRPYDKANSKAVGIGVNDKLYKDTPKALGIGSDLLAGLAGGNLGGSSCSGNNGTAGAAGGVNEKQQCNFITQEVVDATIQCMISQADECEKNGLPAYQTEKMVMEEMGRCLVEIIDFSIRNTDSSFTQE